MSGECITDTPDGAAWWARTEEVGCSCNDPEEGECYGCWGKKDFCPCHLFPTAEEHVREQEVIYVAVPR
jgi:hypothetical protein